MRTVPPRQRRGMLVTEDGPMKAGLAWFGLVFASACLVLFWRADSSVPRERNAPPRELQIASAAPPRFSPEVRVKLTGSPVRELRLAVDGPYRIAPAGSSRTLDEGDRLAETTVRATENGILLGGREYPATRLEIVARRPPAIWVADHQYRGRVLILRQPRGRLLAINIVSLEDYIASVLDSEMPADFPPAARRAQAIVARTYALYQMQEAKDHRDFDLYASTRSQNYLGAQYRDERGRRLAGESESSRKAVAETSGMVCTFRGRVFATYYTAVCGGHTTTGREVFRDAAEPLVSVPCEWCRESRYYRWSAETSREQLEAALRRHFAAQQQPFDGLSSIGMSKNSARNGVPLLQVSDGEQRLSVSAADVRRELPESTLPSPYFQLRDAGDVIRFQGRGHGHGVGFCQWGARGQALAGRTALEILRHYYRDAEILTLDESSR